VYFFSPPKKGPSTTTQHVPCALLLYGSPPPATMARISKHFNDADAAPQVLHTAPKIGNEFDSFQDFKTAMNTWMVAGRCESRFVKVDSKRNVIVFRDSAECVSTLRQLGKFI
jgi:hypothetical protein